MGQFLGTPPNYVCPIKIVEISMLSGVMGTKGQFFSDTHTYIESIFN